MIGTAELIAIATLAATTFISVVAAAYALGGLPRRSEFNDLRKDVGDLRKEVGDLRKEMNDKIDASHKELSDKIDRSNQDLLGEMRRSHQQIMRALINHRHLEPEGEPVFTEPPDTELVAADN